MLSFDTCTNFLGERFSHSRSVTLRFHFVRNLKLYRKAPSMDRFEVLIKHFSQLMLLVLGGSYSHTLFSFEKKGCSKNGSFGSGRGQGA